MKETELLFDLLKKGVSPVQAVRACKERLESAGFLELPYDEPWKLQKNGRYYVNHHDTTLFAFTVGEGWQETKTPQIRMAAAHTDFPCLRIKPSADVTACGYAQVNVCLLYTSFRLVSYATILYSYIFLSPLHNRFAKTYLNRLFWLVSYFFLHSLF